MGSSFGIASVSSDAALLKAQGVGGGVVCSGGHLLLQSTVVTANIARQGGGVFLSEVRQARLIQSAVTDNLATCLTGGVVCAATLIDTTVTSDSGAVQRNLAVGVKSVDQLWLGRCRASGSTGPDTSAGQVHVALDEDILSESTSVDNRVSAIVKGTGLHLPPSVWRAIANESCCGAPDEPCAFSAYIEALILESDQSIVSDNDTAVLRPGKYPRL